MAGPSITDEDKRSFSRRLKVGVVLLVAASGALVALQAGGDLPLVAAGALGGALVGGVLAWYIWWIGTDALSGGRTE
ncbi:hypothetical protein BRD00_15105 [Halobacteriales archaeon QS_8_69_26]|nr:MAG: hypothetical protein BRD00_15105 [Halobacteriales archaeon QS_8_69_26]